MLLTTMGAVMRVIRRITQREILQIHQPWKKMKVSEKMMRRNTVFNQKMFQFVMLIFEEQKNRESKLKKIRCANRHVEIRSCHMHILFVH
uniref:Uncharacterized protein n=1 Tax=Arion vulgaris TaxID=1028688 RepID=A0A0B7B0W5_9EUPU